MSVPTQPERWFYLDGFDANEFCPLWRYVDRFSIRYDPPYNWCLVHYEAGDGFATIEVPPGSYYRWALDRVNESIA
jgi:hypothetical protein